MTNRIYIGANGKESLYDLTIPENYRGKIVLFVHGYMGLKDWGCWNLVQDYFTNLGFGFCKYNVSHNGCSTSDPINFVDLDAFSRNNYTKECTDFESIISKINQQQQTKQDMYVIGHSRGGGIAILTSDHPQVKKVATWAAISDIGSRFPSNEALEEWQTTAYYHKKNGRTHQEMPHHYSQFLDFKKNETRLDIEAHTRIMDKPLLLIHGDADRSVKSSEGEKLAEWSGSALKLIEGAAHTFDSSHPWESESLPEKLEEVCRLTAEFFLEAD